MEDRVEFLDTRKGKKRTEAKAKLCNSGDTRAVSMCRQTSRESECQGVQYRIKENALMNIAGVYLQTQTSEGIRCSKRGLDSPPSNMQWKGAVGRKRGVNIRTVTGIRNPLS